MKRYILLLICLIGLSAANASSQYWEGNIYNVGRYSSSFTFQTTYDAEEIGTGIHDEVFFKFILTQPMQLTLSSLGSEVEDTYFQLYKGNTVIAESDGAEGSEQAYLEKSLAAGEYELSVTKYNTQKKNITISIQGKYNNSRNTFIIGSFDKEFSYKETKNTVQYTNSYGLSSSDVIYDFTTLVPFDFDVTATSASETQTGKPQIYLLDSSQKLIDKGIYGSLYYEDLPAGNYYVVVEGAKGDGEITTELNGWYCFPDNYYDVGFYGKNFTYSSEDSFDSYPDILGNGLGDISYRINLKAPMILTIRHDSNREEHTALHLWNTSLVEIGNSETRPSNIPNAHPGLGTLQMILPAGSYCIISEALDPYTDDVSRNLTTVIEGSLPGDMPADTTQNYVCTRTMTAADGSSFADKVEYYDGLGRPVETVQRKGGGNGEDLVSFLEYDAFGRESNSWLPRAKVDGQGLFVPFDKFKVLSPELYGNDTKAYTKPIYENSPLSRIIEEYGSGEEWHNSGKSVKQSFLTNIAGNDTLNCMLLKVEDEWATDTLVTLKHEENYATGELSVTRTADEDGNRAFEFRDKLGRIVLNRRMEGNAAYDTYFIYNILDAPIAVLPPAASELLESSSRTSWSSNSDDALSQYAYFYKYDSSRKQLCRAKKLPGCAWTLYLYDKSNRLIFTQDGNMRQRSEWHFNLPDVNGRTCLTGISKNSMNTSPYLFNTLITVTPDAAANFGYRIADDAIALTDAVILSVKFYDNYGFMSPDEYIGSTYFSSPLLSYNAESGFDSRYYTDHAEGLLTGTLTAELDGGVVRGYLPSVSYYDYRGNVVQRKSGNQLTEGFEKEYFANNFTGAPLKRKHVHTATGQGTQTELYSYRYDHRGRLLEVNHQLNSNPAVNLLSNRYDALGRLKSTSGHDQAGLQTDYTYNVRSWVKSISSPFFKEDLSYSYNGNISSQQWQQDGKNRKYTFDYDALSRLKQAAYTGDGAYGTAYAYDKMGNITGLQRYDGTMIDNLGMTYQGNRLIKTDDATNNSKGFTDGVKAAKEYFYDANGNLTEDLNKNITAIQYNYLNLPSKITFGDGSTIAYLYGADGAKLRTTHTINGTVTTTDYCDNVIYENGTATCLLTEAGYVSLNDNKYHYYLQDHQGNNRVVVNQSGTVEETNHYYPFGSVFANTNNVQPYKYNGKELDSKKGLNWHDYGARHYDAALGRFMTVDPLSEKYYGISPYGYCANNPVKYVDPTGMLFSDPPGNYFQNLWSYYKEVYKSVSVTLSVGLQVGASAKISNKEVGAHVNVVSGELEVLNDGKFSVNNRSVTQGVDVNVGVVGVGITNEVKDNGSGTTTKTETFKAHAGVLEAGAKTTSEHIENRNGTYTEVSKKTEVFAPTATLSVNAQVLVGAEVKVDIGKIWQAFKDFVENTFNPN